MAPEIVFSEVRWQLADWYQVQTGTTCRVSEWRLMDCVRVTLHEKNCLVVPCSTFLELLGAPISILS